MDCMKTNPLTTGCTGSPKKPVPSEPYVIFSIVPNDLNLVEHLQKEELYATID